MTNVTVKDTINATADEIWKTLSSFRDVEKYIPLVKSSTVLKVQALVQKELVLYQMKVEGKEKSKKR